MRVGEGVQRGFIEAYLEEVTNIIVAVWLLVECVDQEVAHNSTLGDVLSESSETVGPSIDTL